jgi:small subunit ribosomal protein S16
LMIRLARTGVKKKPRYRVVIIEKARARDGRFVEIVGNYNPQSDPAQIELKSERIEYWLGKGAQPSATVRSFLRRKKTAVKTEVAEQAE